MDLFRASADRRRIGQPLAERMRPKSLQEFVGQNHLLGPRKLLARLGPGAALPSLILWGPPGTGKTTLAHILATRAGSRLAAISAVTAGVREMRQLVSEAGDRRDQFGSRTVLFIDEIHRFSKAQQDALLPHVEAGTVTLIGATTENPSFHVNAALLSRCRVLRLGALSDEELGALARRALSDRERGLGRAAVSVSDEVLTDLVAQSGGDARRMLNALEVAVSLVRGGEGEGEDEDEAPRALGREAIEEALQQKTLLYDKAGDEHFGVVSAFIKSMRGSDPDAAAYWMTRMLEAGEDPLFVLRRMVVFASEDIGNADPQALAVATSALSAYQFLGMPEGVLPMTQAAVYMACAPKSNTALTTYAAARRAVRQHGALPVPKKLRNANNALDREMGHAKDYRYPHNFAGHYVPETYLPEGLEGARFYEPAESGAERAMGERVARWRAVVAGLGRDEGSGAESDDDA
ncbi:replication-associated recombination protein A [Haliangium ochraceum]|uniref:Replication-associated recombination protein A n=1 Tax=Haliangium ochraceum (strain DSM 14365 / JCM 11303 / SMP-2) TaxID=502025 RepID=D0LV62_HALO1|nr:AAA ATPase central domain protein [Haliangium ochraceum DSM 14365]